MCRGRPHRRGDLGEEGRGVRESALKVEGVEYQLDVARVIPAKAVYARQSLYAPPSVVGFVWQVGRRAPARVWKPPYGRLRPPVGCAPPAHITPRCCSVHLYSRVPARVRSPPQSIPPAQVTIGSLVGVPARGVGRVSCGHDMSVRLVSPSVELAWTGVSTCSLCCRALRNAPNVRYSHPTPSPSRSSLREYPGWPS